MNFIIWEYEIYNNESHYQVRQKVSQSKHPMACNINRITENIFNSSDELGTVYKIKK